MRDQKYNKEFELEKDTGSAYESDFAIEALPCNKAINLPNLHILAHRKEDGTMAGQCLDFDIWAYSTQANEKEAIQHVFSRICQMVIFQIFTLLKRGALEHLYENRVKDPEKWEEFSRLHAITKTKLLLNSIESLRNNPELRN